MITSKTFFEHNIKELETKQYNEFVGNNLDGNFFQSLEYFNLYKGIKGYKPFIILLFENNKMVASLLGVMMQNYGLFGIKPIISKRSIIIGAPLVENQKYINEILKELNSINKSKKVVYSEVRNLKDSKKVENIYIKENWNYDPHYNFILNNFKLKSNEVSLSKTRKKQINRSIRNGASVIEASSNEEILEFYQLLKKHYAEKVKKPLPEEDFFLQIGYNNDFSKYLLIKLDSKIIGGLLIVFDDKSVYQYYLCGEDGKYDSIYPSALATYAGIEYGIHNNIEFTDFLGAGKPGDNYGVREFKSKFGGDLVEFGRFKKIYNPVIYKSAELYLKMKNK